MPFSSEAGAFTPFVDALFTATSAVGTVGLVVVDTGTYWSLVGQAVILVLMEFGGLGFMAGAIVLFLAIGQRISIRQRMVFRESLVLQQIGGLPGLAKRLLIYTAVIEGVGALLLFLQFRTESGVISDRAGWFAVFHSVSAYTGSGFDLMGDFQSFTGHATRPLLLLTLMALIIPGDLGFMVVLDALRRRRFAMMSLDTKIVLSMNLVLWPLAAFGLFVLEFGNAETLGALSVPHRAMNSLFQAVTMRNAGFSTIPFRSVGEFTLMFTMLFMFVGAASASMGGGIKVNSAAVMLASMRAGLLGKERVEAFGRTIPPDKIYASVTIALLFLAWILISTPIVHTLQNLHEGMVPVLFDTISAVGPIGLSTGVPAELNDLGKLLVSLLMFVGRLGPLTIALILVNRSTRRSSLRYPRGDLKIG
jgi:trk system potassium uptake protein TrkH